LLSIGGLWFITPSEVVGFNDKNMQSSNTWETPRLRLLKVGLLEFGR
jgi:hypothetical protein